MKKRTKDVEEDEGSNIVSRKTKKAQGATSILQAANQLQEQGVYKPRTKDTEQAYERILTFVQQHIGAQPREYLASGADEILAILKDESKTDLYAGCQSCIVRRRLRDRTDQGPKERHAELE